MLVGPDRQFSSNFSRFYGAQCQCISYRDSYAIIEDILRLRIYSITGISRESIDFDLRHLWFPMRVAEEICWRCQ